MIHLIVPERTVRFKVNEDLQFLRHLRWPSLCFGLLAVLMTFYAARLALGCSLQAAFVAAVFGLNPQYLFASGIVSNDTAGTAVAAAAFVVVARAIRKPGASRSQYLWMALLVALGMLTKTSTLPVLAVASLSIFILDKRPLRTRFVDGAWALLVFALVAGPYAGWNTLHRGDPLGMGAVWRSAADLPRPDALGGVFKYLTTFYWKWTFQSYWGRFGWMRVIAPTPFYLALYGICIAGTLGFLQGWRRITSISIGGANRPDPGPELSSFCWYLVASISATVAAHLWLNTQTIQAQGRHLFPVAPQIACLLAMGWAYLLQGDLRKLGRRTAFSLILAFSSLALYCLFGVIAPTYA